jgi:O-antigen/teichoic acid export membrane protein
MALGSAATAGNLRVDQVALLSLAGERQAGLYVVAVAIAEVPDTVFRSMQGIALADHARGFSYSRFARTTGRSLAITLAVATITAICTPVTVLAVFGSDFRGAIPITMILLLAALPWAFTCFTSIALVSLDRPVYYALISAAGLAISLILLVFLVPAHGAIGAGVASLVSYTAMAVLSMVALRRALARRLSGHG